MSVLLNLDNKSNYLKEKKNLLQEEVEKSFSFIHSFVHSASLY